MPRFLAILVVLIGLTVVVAQAQDIVQSEAGDPPIASLISVSAPDENGLVTLSGAGGAVFPGSQIAIRNLYTNALVYTQGGITGSFNAQIAATANTPFWISPAPAIANAERGKPGSLPGGPGTIVYGPFPTTLPAAVSITQLVMDGDLSDWDAYPDSRIGTGEGVHALVNQNSFYLGFNSTQAPADYLRVEVTFSLDGSIYALTLDPRIQEQTGTLRRVEPNPTEIGTLAVAAVQADAIEMRIPLATFSQVVGAEVNDATLEQIRFLGAEDVELVSNFIIQPVPIVVEGDGIVYLSEALDDDAALFALAGTLAQGAYTWSAIGHINTLDFQAGDTLRMQLDVTMNVPDLPLGLTGLDMIGSLVLQPVVGADGVQTAGGLFSNNGWSDQVTPGGLVIDNLRDEYVLGETMLASPQVVRLDSRLIFGLDFTLKIPDDLPDGLYVPVFQGFGQIGDGERFRWEDNSLLGTGTNAAQMVWNRMPLIMNVGAIDNGRLVWTLFQDQPSSGSRGLMAVEDRGALSNRVRFNNATYILPRYLDGTETPIDYSLEPYQLNQMPNLYDATAAPLVPFLFPGGRLEVQVKKPDGTTTNLNGVSILQNRLSTDALDERVLFGEQSQVDVYQLTTLNPEMGAFQFDQYGPHEITLTGNIEDIWGNRYEGGGTYPVLIAEILNILPGALSGTPYEVGDAFYPGMRLLPSAPAEATITVHVYPVDGSDVIEREFSGTANTNGYFYGIGEAFTFDVPGEYVIDYEARYTDTQGRLWAGSLRSAGVIAEPDSVLIGHGQRGLANESTLEQRPAWFNAEQYAPDIDNPALFFPYFSGDVLWYPDAGTVVPITQVQDTTGVYTAQIAQNDLNADLLTARDEVPVFTTPAVAGYTYVSVVRPGVAIRQYVQGSRDGGLPLYWNANDPNNSQTGAGLLGEQVGDYAFLFGGAVVRGEGVNETAIYAALGVVVDADNGMARVFPPYSGQAGGPNGGALLTLNDQPIEMFFHPTGVQPGQVLTDGNTFSIAGHVAPPLNSTVEVKITDPSGFVRQFTGNANRVGYFYDPDNDFSAGVVGVWTVEVKVRHEGLTSAGGVQPPYPSGTLLGSSRYEVYVVPTNSPSLEWNETRKDFPIAASAPFNFNFPIPQGWTNVRVTHTETIPGVIVSMGDLPVSGASFSYQFNATNLNSDFPNVEINTGVHGAAASDPVTLTFAVVGINERGLADVRTHTYHILHDRLITLE